MTLKRILLATALATSVIAGSAAGALAHPYFPVGHGPVILKPIIHPIHPIHPIFPVYPIHPIKGGHGPIIIVDPIHPGHGGPFGSGPNWGWGHHHHHHHHHGFPWGYPVPY